MPPKFYSFTLTRDQFIDVMQGQGDKCGKCGQQFVAKRKIVKETNCDDCLIAKHSEVSKQYIKLFRK